MKRRIKRSQNLNKKHTVMDAWLWCSRVLGDWIKGPVVLGTRQYRVGFLLFLVFVFARVSLGAGNSNGRFGGQGRDSLCIRGVARWTMNCVHVSVTMIYAVQDVLMTTYLTSEDGCSRRTRFAGGSPSSESELGLDSRSGRRRLTTARAWACHFRSFSDILSNCPTIS